VTRPAGSVRLAMAIAVIIFVVLVARKRIPAHLCGRKLAAPEERLEEVAVQDLPARRQRVRAARCYVPHTLQAGSNIASARLKDPLLLAATIPHCDESVTEASVNMFQSKGISNKPPVGTLVGDRHQRTHFHGSGGGYALVKLGVTQGRHLCVIHPLQTTLISAPNQLILLHPSSAC
jgi:hypothetical protein